MAFIGYIRSGDGMLIELDIVGTEARRVRYTNASQRLAAFTLHKNGDVTTLSRSISAGTAATIVSIPTGMRAKFTATVDTTDGLVLSNGWGVTAELVG